MPMPKFDYSINLGHLLQAGVVAAGIATFVLRLEGKIVQLETRQVGQVEVLREHQRAMDAMIGRNTQSIASTDTILRQEVREIHKILREIERKIPDGGRNE